MNDPIPPQEPGTPHDEPSGSSDVDLARHPLRGPRTQPASDPDPEREGPVDPDRREDDPEPADRDVDTLGHGPRRR